MTLTHSFYCGCIFTALRTEALCSSLLACFLSFPKILRSNPGILGWRNFRLCFHTQKDPPGGDKLHWVIRLSPTNGGHHFPTFRGGPYKSSLSLNWPSYNRCVKCTSDSNFSIKIAMDIIFFVDNHDESFLFLSRINGMNPLNQLINVNKNQFFSVKLHHLPSVLGVKSKGQIPCL